MFRSFVLYLLKRSCQKIIKRFSPTVIGLTGSVGKSTTKECLHHILREHFSVLKSRGNYNTEFGLPLAVLELDAPEHKSGWWNVIRTARKKAQQTKTFYEVLVLEMGTQKPGDLEYLTSVVQPDISIVMNVENVHLEFFESKDALAYEKATLVRNVNSEGKCWVNFDNHATRKMVNVAPEGAIVKTFGMDKKADIYASQVQNTTIGLKAYIHHKGQKYAIHCPHIIGKHNIYNIMASWAVATDLGMDAESITKRLKTFRLPPGRMSLIEGIHHSHIIDSSYNAEPTSMKAALDTLKDMPHKGRRIAIIGDMLELGHDEKKFHREIGKYMQNLQFDMVCFIGPRMQWAYEEFNNHSREFSRLNAYYEDSFQAAKQLPGKIKKDDLILIKGSQGIKMLRIVEALRKS